MTTPTQETPSDKERERRRKRYKMAFIRWSDGRHMVESKKYLETGWWFDAGDYEVICDWEPERVLRGMLKLMKEK